MAKSKLQNVKAVKELLAGTHKSQTSRTFGFTGKGNKKREVGDVWIETSPNGTKIQWEQKDGFRVKKSANSIIDEVNKIVHMPEKCPNCDQPMYNEEERLNKKFWKTKFWATDPTDLPNSYYGPRYCGFPENTFVMLRGFEKK